MHKIGRIYPAHIVTVELYSALQVESMGILVRGEIVEEL